MNSTRSAKYALASLGVLAGISMGLCSQAHAASIDKAPFGTMPDGKPVDMFTLKNDHGVSINIITYGGTIQSVKTPDRNGKINDIVLGFNDLPHYLHDVAEGQLYFGAMIGRYANRIAYGTFSLDGHTYHVPINMAPHTLHGGVAGFDKKLWSVVSSSTDKNGAHLTLGLVSPDGDQGFPGTLHTTVTYTLDEQNAFTLQFHATTDKPTVISLTSHSFWNLNGEGSGSVEDYRVKINADRYTPTDPTGIPTGVLAPVDATPFDFREFTRIGDRLREDNPQLRIDHGYDKNFVVRGAPYGSPRLAVTLKSPSSGRIMEIYTTQPGLQFYTSNGLDGRYYGKSGHAYRQTDAIALETEAFPDTPNHPQFPSAVLRPGQAYDVTTTFRFSKE